LLQVYIGLGFTFRGAKPRSRAMITNGMPPRSSSSHGHGVPLSYRPAVRDYEANHDQGVVPSSGAVSASLSRVGP
jgi:hypothetical protein